MEGMALSGVLSIGRWWIFAGGAVWLACAVWFLLADLRAYRRRVSTIAVCVAISEDRGMVRHTLERVPVADEKKLVSLWEKTACVGVGKALRISYDPKRPREVFVESRHPRIVGWSTHITLVVIGIVQIFYVLIRWGVS
ncbi:MULTISPECIES: hypothetical protein [Streptomyces]|uniref:DUF3592 domain-containing protein n=1 Tax=Streptomyces ehimensis TaxID=68195 RepID=A0ABV9BWA4_9ACTN